MRRFVIHFNEFPIRAEDVKAGQNSPQVITAYRCVNVGLFLSNDMRRDVEVNILAGKSHDMRAIIFPGSHLKRVSPDERSITLFLLKANNELDKLAKGDLHRMSNGIQVRRASFSEMLAEWEASEVCVAKEGTLYKERTQSPDAGVFIFEGNEGDLQDALSDATTIPLFRPAHPEQFILEMNLLHDRTKDAVEKSS